MHSRSLWAGKKNVYWNLKISVLAMQHSAQIKESCIKSAYTRPLVLFAATKSVSKPSKRHTVINPNMNLDHIICDCGCQINALMQPLMYKVNILHNLDLN